jgi:hypothetical protein
MADKKDDKPKYDAVPKDQIPPTIYKSQFSSNEKVKTTVLLGTPTPPNGDKKNG